MAKWTFFNAWSWPWPNDLDTQTWPRCGQDVPPYKKEVPAPTASKVVAWTDRQTDKQTDRQTHTHTQTDTILLFLQLRDNWVILNFV